MNTHRILLTLLGTSLLSFTALANAQESTANAQESRTHITESAAQISFQQSISEIVVLLGNQRVATYVHVDDAIPRPYFKDVCELGGQQLTRGHPPIQGKDATDHADMHPGIWLAFGDLSGTDIWRNKEQVVHEGFVKAPKAVQARGHFRFATDTKRAREN